MRTNEHFTPTISTSGYFQTQSHHGIINSGLMWSKECRNPAETVLLPLLLQQPMGVKTHFSPKVKNMVLQGQTPTDAEEYKLISI